MITKDNFATVLAFLGFSKDLGGVWSKSFDNGKFCLAADCANQKLTYPAELNIHEHQTCNFGASENFVVFECVHRLFEQGYKPEHIDLEHPVRVGHGASGGRLDIWLKDNDGKSLLIIECKTQGREFEYAWKNTLEDGGQLFSYANALDSKTPFVALYSSEWNGSEVSIDYRLISLHDNEELLKSLPKDAPSFKTAATLKDRFRAWKDTYQQDFTTRGLFENDIAAYTIGKTKYSTTDLKNVDGSEIQGKYHEFATILRQYNVSGHENAFDKLVNLFLAKIVDETENPNELKFYWKGAAYDNMFDLTDRLQFLYKRGMEEFLKESVTYIDNKDIENAFHLFKKDATKRTILDYFRQLKFFTNNDFAFIDVHNEKLFHQNAAVLLKMVRMLQDIRLQTSGQNQFLGDLFEGFLDRGVKQSEGQYFTPTPFVRFLISSLPLEAIINKAQKPPRVIDYACGAGHFLTEYCHQIFPFVRKKNKAKTHGALEVIAKEDFIPYYAAVTGIEKEYRLSKVSKVSASMYGQGEIRIIYADALAAHPDVQDGTHTVLVANPPYSVKGFLETLSEADRKRFTLLDYATDIPKNNSIECFFVERAKQLLAPGGVAAIILPSSILSNAGIYTGMREILIKYFDIVAIAEFGSGTFGKTGTNTATLFLRRKATKPDLAEHYANRVETWFSGDFSLDAEFEDTDLIEQYCQKTGYSQADYRSLLGGSPSSTLLETDMFREYRKAFDISTEAKRIRKKLTGPKFKATDREAELDHAWLKYLQDAESDKLLTFMLAASNPQPVILVKSPSEPKAMKAFLGYEWSERKGGEGIKYIGTSSSDDDDPIAKIRGVGKIRTPLFNPEALDDHEKINFIIRAAFNGEATEIPISLSEFVVRAPMVDLLDFSRVSFDKAFKTTPDTKTEIRSNYCHRKIGDICELKYGKPLKDGDRKAGPIPVYGSNGVVGYHNERLVKGPFIIVGRKGSAGKLFFSNEDGYPIDTTFYIDETKDGTDLTYLYLALRLIKLESLSKQMGVPGLNRNDVYHIEIPLPPLEIQHKIVAECESVDTECRNARKRVEDQNEKIQKLLTESQTKGQKTFKLSDKDLFCISIGRRVLETELESNGAIPIYSANVLEPFGRFNKLLITDFSRPSVLWGIDGDWMVNFIPANQPFFPTDHCGVLRVLTDVINPRFLAHELKIAGENQRFSRTLRASTGRITGLVLNFPSIAEQNKIVAEVEQHEKEIANAKEIIAAASDRKRAIMKKWLA